MQISKTQQLENWRKGLYSADYEVIKSTLIDIAEHGNIEIMPDVINIFNGYLNSSLADYIYDFLINIKNNNYQQVLVNHIKDKKFAKIKKQLLAICWESSLDFSEYIDDFVDIFIQENFENSFEAYTNILNCSNLSVEKIASNIEKLKNSVATVGENKKTLLVELVNDLNEKLKSKQRQNVSSQSNCNDCDCQSDDCCCDNENCDCNKDQCNCDKSDCNCDKDNCCG